MGLFDLFKPDVYKLEAEKNIPGLCRALSYKHKEHIRSSAAFALGNLLYHKADSRAQKPLIRALQDSSVDVRERAAHTLRYLPSTEVVDALIQSLNHPVYGANISAIETLAVIGDAKAIEPLIAKLHTIQKKNHFLTVFKLDPFSPFTEKIPPLDITSAEPAIRIALRNFNDSRALEAYFELPNQERYISSVTGEVGYSGYNPLYDMKNISASVYLQVLNTNKTKILIECLQSLYFKIFDDVDVVKRIIELLNHSERVVQQAAEKALSHVSDKQCLHEMLKCSYNRNVTIMAEKGLKKIAEKEEWLKKEEAKPAYVKLIERGWNSGDWEQRKKILWAARDHASEFEPSLVIKIVEQYRQAAFDSNNKYFSFYKEGLQLLPIAEQVISKLSGFSHLQDALRSAKEQMLAEANSYDPMRDDSAYQLASCQSYHQTVNFLNGLLNQ